MKVFLDTNILLGLYRLSGPDLEAFAKLMNIADAGKLTIVINEHVVDEFWRNREKIIKDSLDLLLKGKGSQQIPNLVKPYPKTDELRDLLGKANKLIQEINDAVEEEASQNKLKADEVIAKLFYKCKPVPITAAQIERAKLRRDLGNPPGKQGGLGDAINWEWLLETIAEGEDLCIVSGDGDYESELFKDEAKEFLNREWEAKKSSMLDLYKSLPYFLKENFPKIEMADEVAKEFAIEQLENAWNFQATHKALQELQTYVDFNESELSRLLNAFVANNQIYWILSDEDVHAFALKLLELAKADVHQENAAKLKAMFDELEAKKAAIVSVWSGGEVLS